MKLILHPRDYPTRYAMSEDGLWFISRGPRRAGKRRYLCEHWKTMETRARHFFTVSSFIDFLEAFSRLAGVLFVSVYREFGGKLVCIDSESAEEDDVSVYGEVAA